MRAKDKFRSRSLFSGRMKQMHGQELVGALLPTTIQSITCFLVSSSSTIYVTISAYSDQTDSINIRSRFAASALAWMENRYGKVKTSFVILHNVTSRAETLTAVPFGSSLPCHLRATNATETVRTRRWSVSPHSLFGSTSPSFSYRYRNSSAAHDSGTRRTAEAEG